MAESIGNISNPEAIAPLATITENRNFGTNLLPELPQIETRRSLADLAEAQVAFGAPALTRTRNVNNLSFPDDLGEMPNHVLSFTIKSTKGLGSDLLTAFKNQLNDLQNNTGPQTNIDRAVGFLANTAGNAIVAGVKALAEALASSGLDFNKNVGTSSLIGNINLPVPSNLHTAYHIDYDTPSLGPAGQAIKPSDRQMFGISGMDNSSAAQSAVQGAAGVVAQFAKDAFNNSLVQAAGKVALGLALNPQKIVLLQGVGFRRHTFAYRLSPRNKEESDRIKAIIQQFKFSAHPSLAGGGLAFTYPDFFEITTNSNYTFDIGPSFLENIDVEYHGQGFPAYHRNTDGSEIRAPAEVNLTLRFLETEILTRERLLNGRL